VSDKQELSTELASIDVQVTGPGEVLLPVYTYDTCLTESHKIFSVTPTVRGRYDVNFIVSGKHVCPFSFEVYTKSKGALLSLAAIVDCPVLIILCPLTEPLYKPMIRMTYMHCSLAPDTNGIIRHTHERWGHRGVYTIEVEFTSRDRNPPPIRRRRHSKGYYILRL